MDHSRFTFGHTNCRPGIGDQAAIYGVNQRHSVLHLAWVVATIVVNIIYWILSILVFIGYSMYDDKSPLVLGLLIAEFLVTFGLTVRTKFRLSTLFRSSSALRFGLS